MLELDTSPYHLQSTSKKSMRSGQVGKCWKLFSNVLYEVDDRGVSLGWASMVKVVCIIKGKKIKRVRISDGREDGWREIETALKEHFRFVKSSKSILTKTPNGLRRRIV